MPLGRRTRRTIDIWPGFVDALATLVMVIVFVLMVFVWGEWDSYECHPFFING